MNHAPRHPLDDDGETDRTAPADIDLPTTEPRERLEAAFATLPPFTRSVFLAHRLDDLCYADIATITGVSVRRIEREVVRAIVAIDRALSEQSPPRKWWRWRYASAIFRSSAIPTSCFSVKRPFAPPAPRRQRFVSLFTS